MLPDGLGTLLLQGLLITGRPGPGSAIQLPVGSKWREGRLPHREQGRPQGNRGQPLKLGIILPQTQWQSKKRGYLKVISKSLEDLHEELKEYLNRHYFFQSKVTDLEDHEDSINFNEIVAVSPPPSDVLNLLCMQVANSSSAIIYLTDDEKYGRSTASSQYFLQLAGYLGIPVIAWNADNSGLERRTAREGLQAIAQLQLAPGIEHQIAAMFSILVRYNWNHVGVVTSEIAGHEQFVQCVRETVASHSPRFVIQDVFKLTEARSYDVMDIVNSEVRIMLLYCTQREASLILAKGAKAGLNTSNYLWIVTQSVVGDPSERIHLRDSLPVGMLGIHFDPRLEHVLPSVMPLAAEVYARGAVSFLNSTAGDLSYDMHCMSNATNWEWGHEFFKHLLNVTMHGERVFRPDGTVRRANLKVVNLRPMMDSGVHWEEVGSWNTETGLDIKDIVWPNESRVPPKGVPEKFSIKITFLEEPPFIMTSPPDSVTGRCSMDRGVPCTVPSSADGPGKGSRVRKCCSGLCVDLLHKFETDLGFSYDLARVEDPKFGTFEAGTWNGLMAALVNKETDMVLSALKISSEREEAVDFTVPFLESGIAIVVAKRTGIISPTAFLEPFDTSSWMLVALVAVQAAALSIFIFEWLSPAGYNMKVSPRQHGHKFSLFRTYWLVCAVLFQASVSVDCPRGLTSRFMSSIWALFAVVFLAIYTANLAAFMIPRKEYHDFTGIHDPRISNPMSHQPPLRFSTLPFSYSSVTLKSYHPEVHNHMLLYQNYTMSTEAIRAVKDGSLDAFIYDGTVLSYMVSTDEDCTLLQVGSWSAMTGYGLAFPTNSKYKSKFNEKLLEYRENGDLERLGRFWLHGVCNKPNMQEKRASEPLSIDQFLSAFLLLILGTLVSLCLLICEHFYVGYAQRARLRQPAGDHTKANFLPGLGADGLGQSNDRLLVRSCSIPESLAKEWESTGPQCAPSCLLPPDQGPRFQNSLIKPGSCRTDLCTAKFGHLKGELEVAQAQIRVLECQLADMGISLLPEEVEEKETVL